MTQAHPQPNLRATAKQPPSAAATGSSVEHARRRSPPPPLPSRDGSRITRREALIELCDEDLVEIASEETAQA